MRRIRWTHAKLTLSLTMLAAVAALAASPVRAESMPADPGPVRDGRLAVAVAGPWFVDVSGQEGTPSPAPGAQADADEPDILKMALLTLAGVGGGAAFFTLAYLIRRRIGFDLHQPPEDGGEAGTGH